MKTFTRLSGLGILLAALSGGASAEEAQAARIKFTVDAKPLRMALNQWAQQSGLSVVFPSGQPAADRVTAKVDGEYSAQEALELLLKGSGLTWSYVDRETVAIRAKGEKSGRNLDPADQMRVAMTDEEGGLGKEHAESGEKDAQQMVVEGEREKPTPFVDGNMDLPRTINDAQPYYIFDKETIERSGATSLEDFIKQRLTMNTVAQTNGQMSGAAASSGNTSIIDLRGLGSDKTLILVNGRRVTEAITSTANGSAQQPDLNGIPLSAIERVEVLPSSASGIYGGSAIGGVVNVILKKDYAGGEIRATYDNAWGAEAPRRTISASYGWTLHGGKTRMTLNGSWSDSKPLTVGDRQDIFKRNVAAIQDRSPEYFYSDSNPWLGAQVNIINKSVYAPVGPGTSGAIGPFPAVPPYSTLYGVTEELPYLLFTQLPLVLDNGTVLGSSRTSIAPGISPDAATSDLYASLQERSGTWSFDFPGSYQDPTGLLRPLDPAPRIRSVQGSIQHQLWTWLDVFAEFSYAENKSSSALYSGNTWLIDADWSINPFSSDVLIRFPDSTFVPFPSESTNRVFSVGAIVKLPRHWSGEFDYSRSENRFKSFQPTFDTPAINDAMSSGTLNPFVDTLSYPLGLNEYIGGGFYKGSSRLDDFAIRLSGDLPGLPWSAPVTSSLGLERRISETPRRALATTLPFTVTSNYTEVDYERGSSADSAYAEAHIPLVKRQWFPGLHALELQLSGRGERFTVDTGTTGEVIYYNSTPPSVFYTGPTLDNEPYYSQATYTSTNYTVGIKYQPVADVILRASRASAFLPPAPSQLIKNPEQSSFQTPINDPVTGVPLPPVYTLSGGNPDLKPQNSKSFNAGIVWQPMSGLLNGARLNIEYYNIEQFDAIGTLGVQAIVNQEGEYPGRVVRDGNGVIVLVDNSNVNLYRRDTEGVDISLEHGFDTSLGRFSVQAMGSVIRHLKTQYSQAAPEFDAAGYHPAEGGASKYKSNLNLQWQRGELLMGWGVRYFGSYRAYGAAGGPYSTQYSGGGVFDSQSILIQGSDTIPSQIYHDLYGSYSFGGGAGGGVSTMGPVVGLLEGVTVQIGVKNIFSTVPPLDTRFGSNFFISPYGDTRLRSFWLNVRKEFN